MSAPSRGMLLFNMDILACRDIARRADAAGFDAVWTTEWYDRSALVTMAAMAAQTEHCRIGSSIAYGVGRSPVMTVAEARDLDRLSDGRTVLGLGNGTRRMMADWHGVDDASAPAVRMEELVTVIRKLFRAHEGPVRHEGRFYRVDLRPTGELLEPRRPAIPVYTAGVNPRMIETAGRVADGVLLHPIHSPRYIAEVARPAVQRGAERTGRDAGDVAIVAAPICVVHDDVEQARREAAGQIAFYTVPKSYAFPHEVNGFAAEAEVIRGHFAAGDMAAARDAVSDRMIDTLALAGTPRDVEAGLAAYDGLVDHVQLYSPSYNMSPERVVENLEALLELVGPGHTGTRSSA